MKKGRWFVFDNGSGRLGCGVQGAAPAPVWVLRVWSHSKVHCEALRRVISQINVGRDLSVDVIESCVLTLELVYREFVTVSTIDTQ